MKITGPRRLAIGVDGIRVAAKIVDDTAIVLMADMQNRNDGMSLTNGVEYVMSFVSERFLEPNGMDITDATFCELDSEGYFDLVRLSLGCAFEPLGSRTMDDFISRYGGHGVDLLNAIGIYPNLNSGNHLSRTLT